MNIDRHLVLALALGALAFGSALAVVLAKHESRKLFAELQELEAVRDSLNVEWGQLQLEEGSWSTHSRIETVARKQLKMRAAQVGDMEVIRP